MQSHASLEAKADILRDILRKSGTQDDIFGLGSGGTFKGKNVMYKACETTIDDERNNQQYQGTYYGEVIFDPSG